MNTTKTYKPKQKYLQSDDKSQYWIDKNKLYYRNDYLVRGADIESFEFYLGGFAKDKNNCYLQNVKIQNANPKKFHALNYTYATDNSSVWVLSGEIKGADANSFEVCDDGLEMMITGGAPYGYAKDKNTVYYFNFKGKAKIVKKANVSKFISFNDSYFGKDDKYIFFGKYTLPKACVGSWLKLGKDYSKDNEQVFYQNKLLKLADAASFEVITDPYLNLAKDNYRFYNGISEITEEQFNSLKD